MKAFFRYVALGIALGSLGVFVVVGLYSWVFQKWESYEFDRAPEASTPAAGKQPAVSAKAIPPPSGPVGRISVHRLHLSAMVEEGDDDETLTAAVGHIRGTALPGALGNVGLAGHRDSFFRGLKDLQLGDEIEFETKTAVYRYTVDQMMVVDPKNTSVLARSGDKKLTLVTCYPFGYIGSAPRRFIAQAKQTAELARAPREDRKFSASRAGSSRPK